MPTASKPDDDGLVVRTATQADRAEIERLLREGFLPDYAEYQTRSWDHIAPFHSTQRRRFFVAVAHNSAVGTVALAQDSRDIGYIHWLRVDPLWQDKLLVARRLVRAAVDDAKDAGLLKLGMHVPAEIEQRVARYYHLLGFELSRTREIDGVHVLEFYLNLYEKPPLKAS